MRQATETAEAPRKVALVLEYDGTAYAGFQRQANAPSVQASVEEAWRLLTGSAARLKAAGRTDAGVHATGQVVAFRDHIGPNHGGASERAGPLPALRHRGHGSLRSASGVRPPARRLSRVYRYTLLSRRSRSPLRRRSAYLVGRPVDIATMQECLAYLEGMRDFAPFSGPVDEGASTIGGSSGRRCGARGTRCIWSLRVTLSCHSRCAGP